MRRMRPPLAIDEGTVRQLVEDQFPAWADLPVRRVDLDGWDNRSFRLGDHLVARLPSALRYAAQVEREQCWLPVLAPVLPVAIPIPMGRGRPGRGYPFDWSIYKWIPGEPLATVDLSHSSDLARRLASFLVALQSRPTEDGPSPGPQNFHRGGRLAVYDKEMRSALDRLPAGIRTPVSKLWRDALAAQPSQREVWLHGDFAPRNLLVRQGRLCGVIDFGQVAVGDPACDLTITWTYLRGQARPTFRDEVGADAATWARARGWAAWKAAILLSGVASGPTADIDSAALTLQAVLQDQ